MNANVAQRYLDDGMAVTPKPQLVLRLYERLCADLDAAAEAIDGGRIEPAHHALVHAQEIVYELNVALDIDAWAEGRGLRQLYEYLSDRLVEANVGKNAGSIREVLPLVRSLHETWREAHALNQRVAASPVAGDAEPSSASSSASGSSSSSSSSSGSGPAANPMGIG